MFFTKLISWLASGDLMFLEYYFLGSLFLWWWINNFALGGHKSFFIWNIIGKEFRNWTDTMRCLSITRYCF